MKGLILAAAFVVLSVNSVAETEGFMAPFPSDKSKTAQATWWAKCAATMDIFGQLAGMMKDDKTLATHYNEVGNGAETTAFVFLMGDDMAAGDMDRVRNKWEGRMEMANQWRLAHLNLLNAKASASVQFMREMMN